MRSRRRRCAAGNQYNVVLTSRNDYDIQAEGDKRPGQADEKALKIGGGEEPVRASGDQEQDRAVQPKEKEDLDVCRQTEEDSQIEEDERLEDEKVKQRHAEWIKEKQRLEEEQLEKQRLGYGDIARLEEIGKVEEERQEQRRKIGDAERAIVSSTEIFATSFLETGVQGDRKALALRSTSDAEKVFTSNGCMHHMKLFTFLVEEARDILGAKALFEEIASDAASWEMLKESDVYRTYMAEVSLFYAIGDSCFAAAGQWFKAYSDHAGTQTIHGCLDENNPSVLHYRVCAEIPANLKSVIAVTHEVQFLPEWNTLVANEPKVIGQRTAHYMVLNYQLAALGGMIKFDILNVTRRFTHAAGGFMAEFVESVEEGHPSYVSPCSGFQRPKTKDAKIWAACGNGHTVLIQAGTLRLPFAVSQWLASAGGYVAGKFIVNGLINNALLATVPGNRWEDAVAEDAYGLYQCLEECVAAEASVSRTPSCDCVALGLPSYFQRA